MVAPSQHPLNTVALGHCLKSLLLHNSSISTGGFNFGKFEDERCSSGGLRVSLDEISGDRELMARPQATPLLRVLV